MLTPKELEQSPLFSGISYEEYLLMFDCFRARQKSFRPEDLVYDFSAPESSAVGIIERGTASLIRIDRIGGAGARRRFWTESGVCCLRQ